MHKTSTSGVYMWVCLVCFLAIAGLLQAQWQIKPASLEKGKALSQEGRKRVKRSPPKKGQTDEPATSGWTRKPDADATTPETQKKKGSWTSSDTSEDEDEPGSESSEGSQDGDENSGEEKEEADDSGNETNDGEKSDSKKAVGPSLNKPGEWVPFVEMGEQLFPSFLISTALITSDRNEEEKADPQVIGDRDGLMGVIVLSPKENAKIRVEIAENAYMDAARLDAVLPKANEEYYLFPPVSFKFEALKNQKQPVPLSIRFSTALNGEEAVTQPKTVMVRSINDCPTSFANVEDDTDEDISFMFAAYVNESHPLIDSILKEALDTKIVKAFTGYQSEDREEVLNQVYAVWAALQKRGIKYSSITTPSGHSEAVFSQSVRFFEESLKNSQANCVDGSALLASILFKIGIKPFLVLVPGHMYLGFYVDSEQSAFACLETTLLAGGTGKKFFQEVVNETTDEFMKVLEILTKDENPEYQIIDIEEARKIGILPISSALSK